MLKAVMHNQDIFEYPHTKSYEIARIETWYFASSCHCLFILDSMHKNSSAVGKCLVFIVHYSLFIVRFQHHTPFYRVIFEISLQRYDLSPNRNSQKAPNFVFSCMFFKFFENYCFDCHVNLFSQSAIACFIVRYL